MQIRSRLMTSAALLAAMMSAIVPFSSARAGGVEDIPLPAVQTHPLQPQQMVQQVVAPWVNVDQAMKEDDIATAEGAPLRFAIRNPVELTPANSGTWEALDDQNSVWRLRVASLGAVSLNFGFTRYSMPEGARLYIYSSDLRMVIRPFTAADNHDHQQLWTPPVAGEEAVIELTVPNHLRRRVQLTLGSINVGYRAFGIPSSLRQEKNDDGGIASGSCNIDVKCPEGNAWQDQIHGVAVYTVNGSWTCTGSMVNNTANDRKNYFLTANHCGIDATDDATVVCYWNYENSTCRPVGSAASGGAGDGPLTMFTTGSDLRANFATSDVTLIELSQAPNPAWGVTYNGWSREDVFPPSGAAIHHPSTDEKRITLYDIALRPDRPTHTSSWGCTDFPGTGGDGTHIKVYWAPNKGVTEPGSSGSPLFDNNKRIIGQLHGGASACGATGDNLSDCYGRVWRSWTGGGTSATRLSDWLDPLNTGSLTTDTIGRGLTVSPATAVTHVGLVGGPFTPASTVYNISNTTGSSANYSVSIVGGGTAPLTLNGGAGPIAGSLANGASINITVAPAASATSLVAGVYVTNVQFQDTTNNLTQNVGHTIEIGQVGYTTTPANGLSSGGPLGGPFSGSQVYTLTSTRPTPATVVVTASAPWISINGVAGPVNVNLPGNGSVANVTIGFSATANSLANGLYNGTVTFNALSGGTASNTSRPVALDVGRYSYAATGMPMTINDLSTLTSTINVTDQYCVGDVDLPIDITHTFKGDLVVEIKNPAGTVVRLHNRTGGGTDDLIGTYDDEGALLPDGPGSLAAFDGQPVQGVWTLTVSDQAGGDVGTLNAWTLKIASGASTCPPIANAVAASVPALKTSAVGLNGLSGGGGTMDYVILSLPANGLLFDPITGAINSVPHMLAGHGSAVNYRPIGAYTGSDVFDYKVQDTQSSSSAPVNLTVGGPRVVVNFPLTTNPGWTTSGDWAFGAPSGANGDPSSGFSGANVYGYNLTGAYPNNLSPVQYLTTGAINLTGRSSTQLRFKRWLGVESSTYDHANVQVSNNGMSWTTLWDHSGPTLNETAWSTQTYSIAAVADNAPTVYVRWGMGTTDGSVTYGGWNIDDVQILAITPPCPADVNNDNLVNTDDLITVITQWGPCSGCLADLNFTNSVNTDDLVAVITQWGACP